MAKRLLTVLDFTNFKEQSRYSEANSHSACQEIPALMVPEGSSPCSQKPTKLVQRQCVTFHNKMVLYGELLAPRPTPKMDDHPLLAVLNCLFDIFAATLHI